MKKLFFIFALLSVSLMSWTTEICDQAIGHGGNPEWNAVGARALLSIEPTGNTNEYTLTLKPNTNLGDFKLDYLYVIASGNSPYPAVAGVDEDGNQYDELSVTFTNPNTSTSFNIQWSTPGWDGRWGCDVTNVALTSLTACVVKSDPELTLSEPSVTLSADDPAETYNINPGKATGSGALSYESSNPLVASVDENGVVTAVGRGIATITVSVAATATHYGDSKELTVTVTETIDWSAIGWLSGSSNKYKLITFPEISDTYGGKSIAGENLRICFPSAEFGAISIPYTQGGAALEFALSNFTEGENSFTVVCQGTTYMIYLYYVGSDPEPTAVYDTNFALQSNGATSTAKSGNNPGEANDNNKGSRWWSSTDAPMTDAEKDDQWWQVDLGQRRIFNTIHILWEGAWGQSFDIQMSNDGSAWTTIKEIRDQDLSAQTFPYLQILTLDANKTARYVRFQGIKRGTGYSYSFFEFRVLLPSASVLTTLAVDPATNTCEVDQETVLSITALDQNEAPMAVSVDYSVSPAAAGTVSDGKYTPARIGEGTITITSGVKNASCKVYGYTGSNLSQNKSDDKISVSGYDETDNLYPRFAFDTDDGTLWSARHGETGELRIYDAWISVDLGNYYDINLIAIKWEGACSRHYHVDFSDDNSTWRTAYNAGWDAVATHWEYLYGTSEDNTKVRYLRLWSTEATSQYGIKVMAFRIFGSAWVAPSDSEKPVMGTVSLVSRTDVSAILSVTASDNTGIGYYHVVDASKSIDQTIVADANVEVTGLSPETTYSFTVTAKDFADNESDNNVVVSVTTDRDSNRPWTSAPAPTQPKNVVRSVYSDTYEWALKHDYNKNSWSWITYSEQDNNGDHFILYNLTANWFALGMDNDGESAIIAKDTYTDGVNKGLDVRQMKYLHVDVWTKASSVGPVFFINDDQLAAQNIDGAGWHSYDFPLNVLAENKLNNVRWMKMAGFNGISTLAIDNVYFWTDAVPTTPDGWATYSPSEKVAVPSGVTAYWAEYQKVGGDEQLVLHAITENVIPAGAGVILYGANNGMYDFTATDATAPDLSLNVLTGCSTQTDITTVAETNDIFCIRYIDGYSSAFYQYYGTTVAAHKAYLALPKAGGGSGLPQRKIRFVFHNEQTTTGIENADAEALQTTKFMENGQLFIRRGDAVYTIQGARVQ